MGSKTLTDQQAGYAGGLNTVSDPAFLGPDQARQMANFRLSAYGAALKRLGTQLTKTTALGTSQPIIGGMYWPGLLLAIVAGDTDGKLYTTTYGNFPRTWTAHAAPVGYSFPTFTVPCVFQDASQEVVYYPMTGGTPAIGKFDGASVTAVGAIGPTLVGFTVYNDRMWGWKNTANTLYYSNLASAVGSTGGDSLGDVSAGGGAIVIKTFGEANIRRAFALGASLMICHQRGISRLTGFGQDDTDVQPQGVSQDVSILGTNCMCLDGPVAYIATVRGLYRVTEASAVAVATPERPDPLPAAIASSPHPSFSNCVMNRATQEVWVNVFGVGVYIYHTILGSWSGPFTGIYASNPPYTMFEVIDTSLAVDLPRIWMGQDGGFVQECDRSGVYKDNVAAEGTGGLAVTATLQLHRMFCGDRIYAKTFRWLNVQATLTQGATAPTMAYTNSVNGSGTLTFQNVSSVEKSYYLSPGGTGIWLDATISDAGTAGTSQYAVATVQANFLGQR